MSRRQRRIARLRLPAVQPKREPRPRFRGHAMDAAPCPKTLREQRYVHIDCRHVTAFRFARDYIPFRRWWFTCAGCGRYGAHDALGRPLTRGWR